MNRPGFIYIVTGLWLLLLAFALLGAMLTFPELSEGKSSKPHPTHKPHPTAVVTPRPSASPSTAPTSTPSTAPTSTSTISTPAPTPTTTANATPSGAPVCTSLQTQINGAAAGSTLNVAGCSFTGSVTINKALTIVGPATLTGGGLTATASDVTIDRFTVSGGNPGDQNGIVQARGVNRFTFKNGHISGTTTGACIDFGGGTGDTVTDSELDHCAQEGTHVHDFAAGVLIARNHIHHNNPNHKYGFGGEAGGGKTSRSTATIEDNEVDHNLGPGIWCDPCYTGSIIRRNKVHHNASAGIFVEISDGVTVADNAAWENSWFADSEWGWAYGAGVLVSSSQNNDVRGNVSAWNQDGITMLSQSRSDSPGNGNNNLHDNVIVMAPQPVASGDEAFTMGFVQDWSGGLFDAGKNNRGSGNRYWHSQSEPTSCRFAWNGCLSTLGAFNATPAEEGGTYLTTAQRDGILLAAGVPATAEAH